jgi:cell shape-determining protein MreC
MQQQKATLDLDSLKAENEKMKTQIKQQQKATLDLDSLKAENEKMKTQITQERKASLDLTEETISILSLFSGSQIKTMKALD